LNTNELLAILHFIHSDKIHGFRSIDSQNCTHQLRLFKNGENINEKEFFLAKIYKKTQNVCVITKIVLPLQHYKWLSEVLQL